MKTSLRKVEMQAVSIAWLLLTTTALCIEPDLPFNSGSTGADGPLTFPAPVVPRRYGAEMAHDKARHQAVLFGGYLSGANTNDTWLWNGTNWLAASPLNSPPGRRYFSMAYDEARQEIVLFGGVAATGRTNDTWIWNGTNWFLRTPTTSPTNLSQHRMAYDAARQQIIMFGGNTPNDVVVNDTWAWNGTDWLLLAPADRPSARHIAAMAYDGAREEIVLFGGNDQNTGLNDTWIWNGSNWVQRVPSQVQPQRRYAAMAFDAARQEIVLFGGYGNSGEFGDTRLWDGTNWTVRSGSISPSPRYLAAMAYDSDRQEVVLFGGFANTTYYGDGWVWTGSRWLGKHATISFDMSGRSNGVWNFTTIDVPQGVEVVFNKNAANTPVRWLATGDINIRGRINLAGVSGSFSRSGGPGIRAFEGGPGGFSGGLAGIPFAQGSSYAGTPGQGPGGGAAGIGRNAVGGLARYASVYGNSYIQPLIGGSGGGGSGSDDTLYGDNGGGGGGAILIASSRDISITGQILADGGLPFLGSTPNQGGSGSGGAVRLQADRINITGQLVARDDGRIRLESYYRDLTGFVSPSPSISAPVANQAFDVPQTPLLITSVAGQNVVQPPGGDPLNPDVIFTAAGDITVTVQGNGIPNGSPVRLRVTTTSSTLNATNTLSSGTATFTLTVPRGHGTMQAFADFMLSGQ